MSSLKTLRQLLFYNAFHQFKFQVRQNVCQLIVAKTSFFDIIIMGVTKAVCGSPFAKMSTF